MRFRLRNLAACVALSALALGSLSWLHAAEQNSAGKTSKDDTQSIDLFAGIDSGDLQVKFIAKSDREASLVIENKTKKPVSVKLPDAFVGVPVLAQNNNGNGGGNRNRNNNNNNNQNQNLGGGGQGGFGGGGGIFNLPPEKSGSIKMPVVCLDHGKKDPTVTVPYEIRPIESFTKDAQLVQLLTMLGNGQLDQRAAQAVAWHLANGMSWQELAAKKIHHLGGRPDEPYFTTVQMQLALRIASQAEQLAKDHPLPKTDDSFSASSDSKARDSANSTSFSVGVSASGK
ncbi:MAG TPA: hypothetical protein VGJ15_12515 [Pirellulales bacterium]